MTTMQAVVKTARGEGNVALRELPQPRPGPGQVLLAVRAAGICGTDLAHLPRRVPHPAAGGPGT